MVILFYLAGVVRLYPVAVPEIFIDKTSQKFRPLPTAYSSLNHPQDALGAAAHDTLRVPFVQATLPKQTKKAS